MGNTMGRARLLWLAGCLVLLAVLSGLERGQTMTYPADEHAFANAQMGYAPGVRDVDTEGTTLRYLGLSWRELEPEEGAYAWAALEERCHLADLRAAGVHLVLRVYCDEPGAEEHLDIPDWLYEKTKTGSWYATAYGKGYTPDYADPTFRRAHAALLDALGAWLGEDGFVSYVELGSLGHWGEWHLSAEAGTAMPGEAIRDEYVRMYQSAFPTARLLLRRPFRIAAEEGLGVYNDMIGAQKDTETWLSWLEQGGHYGDEPEALAPMADSWQHAPRGGELTSGIPMEQLLTTELDNTRALLQRSHLSFIGPKIPERAYPEGYEALLSELGYRLRVEQATLAPSGRGAALTLTLVSEGSTPFYWDWPVNLYVEENGTTVETVRLQVALSTLLPGQEVTITARLHSLTGRQALWKPKTRARRVSIGIVDPMTGQDAVRLAMQAPQENGRTILFRHVA